MAVVDVERDPGQQVAEDADSLRQRIAFTLTELFVVSEVNSPLEGNAQALAGYLDMLAGRLKLPDALIDHVEATIKSASTVQPAPVSVEPAGASTSVPRVNPTW